MAEYYAKSNDSLSFELINNDKLTGKITYRSWFNFNAVIELEDHQSYQIEPRGFWGTTIELKDNEKVLLKFRMNWNGEIIVQTYFDGVKESFVFKHRGIFKDSFVLTDKIGTELLVMKPHFKWNLLNYEYQINTSDEFENYPNNNILLLTSLHCANYYMSMMVVV
ncbi:Uncharacterised protein [Chryseobacterium nakagawai]|uniref:Uncharacterized protein n=1 Tax=Chryseobacterium nakagawai TaxID=1241982 RepID=A0AAD1DSE6_CHRNA|nr:hypothetical protein [Chryseobacterium nakagawai]AZA93437.1 hypothetical protein EG343_23915 [Chryseobacterium nakagawai]VEH20116.1 Uncharacterised protein [Chryseobacterium nakagawai]